MLGFDKTFNLGEIHVTLGVFKQLANTLIDTLNHPIFAGPMFLHGHSDYETYRQFFLHLASQLESCYLQPITGTDQEEAMCKAIAAAFPAATGLSCT